MKIIIAGAGAVGTHLAKLLSREHHDITLMDESPEKLEDLSSNFDILTLPLSPSSVSGLHEAEAEKADLFIGVTPDEAHNMTACMLASSMGAKKTVARVDNDEYVMPELSDFFNNVGINSIIYPEKLAGEEILHNIKRSWIRQWWEVQNGELILLAVKIRGNAQILDQPLRVLCGPDSPYHIVAIKRGSDTVIPHGSDCLHELDIVYFMTTPKYINYIRDLAGKEDYPDVSNIFVMGGGSTAVHLVNAMPDYMHAKVIESDAKRAERLNELVKNRHTLIIHGDGRDLALLEEEGIRKAQAFAALTENSETNILACLAAKRLGVSKTVAMVENTDYISMAESLDIGTIINKKTFAASHIYRMMLQADVTSVKSLTVANADVAEYYVSPQARIIRRPVKDLHLPSSVTLGGLVRNGHGQLINGMTQIQPGDTVVAFCLAGGIKKLEDFF
ncbi:potassium transporter peripheral membrane component [Prevotella sp. CAG:891]|jgi:trk system potassium uptake protein TrkA|nr:Trk system potassium transporter TrkA [Prevotellamassilia sp.]CDE86797.1 potassium transporter peripheral membrane component [Prevotella sp. CAG:891]